MDIYNIFYTIWANTTMTKKFKTYYLFRKGISFIAISFFIIATYITIDSTIYSPGSSLIDVFPIVFFTLCLIYFAIIINRIQYFIKDNKIIIRNSIKKYNEYKISEIETIEEIEVSWFVYVKIFFKERKWPLSLILDKQKDFIYEIKKLQGDLRRKKLNSLD